MVLFNQNNTSFTSTNDPSKLNIYTGPTSVLADNSTYNCIFVQLQDSTGQPARALQDTTISLSSSLTNIGTVESAITILKGTTYAPANFKTTFSPRNYNLDGIYIVTEIVCRCAFIYVYDFFI